MGKRMKTLYLHIGTHKTGSTTLQTFLTHNKRTLEAKGIFYPTNGSYFSGCSQKPLALAILPAGPGNLQNNAGPPVERYIREIRQDIQRTSCDKILLSAEHFSHSITREDVLAIRDLFSPLISRFKVIVYLRRQDKRIESGYNQMVKTGRVSCVFEEYVEKVLSDANSHLFYDRLLSLFSDIFGKTNLMVRPFEKSQLNPKGIISDFLGLLGIDSDSDFRVTDDKNQSLPLELIEVMRLYGSQLLGIKQRKLFNQFVTSAALDIDLTKYTFFSSALRRRVLGFFEESNRYVARDYLGLENRGLFLEPTEDGTPRYRGLSAERLLEISAKIWLIEEDQKAAMKRKIIRLKARSSSSSLHRALERIARLITK